MTVVDAAQMCRARGVGFNSATMGQVLGELAIVVSFDSINFRVNQLDTHNAPQREFTFHKDFVRRVDPAELAQMLSLESATRIRLVSLNDDAVMLLQVRRVVT